MMRLAPIGFADDMLACMAQKGFVPDEKLIELANPLPGTNELPVDRLACLWRDAAETMNDEFLGQSLRPMLVGSFKLVCYYVLHTETLKKAIPRILDSLRILSGNLHGALSVEDGTARIVLRHDAMPAPAFAQRMYWVMVHGLSCWLVGRRIPLKQVDFTCGMPAREDDYRMLFGARVRFDRRESSLTFDERFLHLPIRRSESQLKAFLRGAPANILVRYRQEADLTSRILGMLTDIDPDEWPRLEQVSRRFGISTASLRRQLAREGQSFQAIKEDVRKRLTFELLARQSLSVADVAARVGFKDPGAFYRAVRKWTGATPRTVGLLRSGAR